MNEKHVIICLYLVGILFLPSISNALSIKMEPQSLFSSEVIFDAETGAPKRTTVTPANKFTLDITQEQIDIVIEPITKILIDIIDMVDPLKKIKGIFNLFTDTTGYFDIQQILLADATAQLELIPNTPINSPGEFGLIDFEFEAQNITDFGNIGFVQFTSVGSVEKEIILEKVKPIPEPSTIFLMGSGLVWVTYLRRNRTLLKEPTDINAYNKFLCS